MIASIVITAANGNATMKYHLTVLTVIFVTSVCMQNVVAIKLKGRKKVASQVNRPRFLLSDIARSESRMLITAVTTVDRRSMRS